MSSEPDVDIPKKEIEGFDVRYTVQSDGLALNDWLSHPTNADRFAMSKPSEVKDSVQRWISYSQWQCSLTGTMDGAPCAIATLYLQPYVRLAHQSEMGIVVSPRFQGKGIGGQMMRNLIHLAKETFKVELLHLTVMDGSPAIQFYERLGFKVFARQEEWMKQPDGTYVARVFMEKWL